MYQKVEIRTDLIITIDGPSGAGKSTVAKMLAKALHYAYIDTGAMYRGVAVAYTLAGEPEDMAWFLKSLSLKFDFTDGATVSLQGKDITGEIRNPPISLLASRLSQNRSIREYLWHIQRTIGQKGGVVLEGRDTGSVVFPDAHLKFYLDADAGERAKRRHLELEIKNDGADLATVKTEMMERDKNDSEREIAPLVIPEGAIRIDTTGIDAQGVVDLMLRRVSGYGGPWKS
jgi:CMP/dCMP kinase